MTAVEPLASAPADPVGGFVLGSEADFFSIPLEQRPFLFRHMEELSPYPTRLVRHGEYVRPLPRGAEIDVNAVIDGMPENIDSFMQRYHTAALLVIKDGEIRAERYRYGNTPRSRWVMFSVTKSVVSTAVAAAVQEGKIGSIDDQITVYVPELIGSPYEGVSIRDALNMTSGVDRQNMHGQPGANPQRDAYYSTDPHAVYDYLRTLKRFATPGSAFNYNDADTHVLGLLVTKATGMPLASYISKMIWAPAGMEDDAIMRLSVAGQEIAHGGLSATLRDIGRFGMFAMDGGVANGRQMVPPDWFAELSNGGDLTGVRAPGRLEAAPDFGYALHWWTIPRGRDSYELGDDGGFAALGIFGQQIYVVPKQNLVIALQTANVIGRDPPLFNRGRDLATAIALQFKRDNS